MSQGKSAAPASGTDAGAGGGWRSLADGRAVPLIAFLVVTVITVAPLLLHRYLPLADLPNHIARHYIAANPDAMISQFYRNEFKLVPNSAADILWHVLGYPGDPVRFSQLVMASYAVLLIAATMTLARVVHGRWTVWSAAAALLVYNLPLFLGFQNFLLSVPFALFGLALWLAMEGAPALRRSAVFVPLALALFTMHLFGFVALGAAAFGRECHRVMSAPTGARRRQAAEMALAAVPFLIPLIWLAYDTRTGPGSVADARTEYGGLWERWLALISPLHFLHDQMPMTIGLLLFLAALFLSVFRRTGLGLDLKPMMVGPVIALLILSVATPSWLNDVAWVHIRFPLIFGLVMIAATVPRISRTQAATLTLAIMATLVGRGVAIERQFSAFSREITDIRATLESLPEGAPLLPLWKLLPLDQYFLLHLDAYAVLWRGAFVPTLFRDTHALEYRSEWQKQAKLKLFSFDVLPVFAPDRTPDRVFVYRHNPEGVFTHALTLDDLVEVTVVPGLRQIARQGRYTLYEITSTPDPAFRQAE